MAGCKICRQPITWRQRTGYCKTCRASYCNHCDAPLPEGRIQRRCFDCDKEQREQWKARGEKRCSDCGELLEAGAASRWCSGCRRVYRETQLAALRRLPGRACFRCGQAMPVGRWDNYCTDCARQRRHELADTGVRRAESRAPRRCADCHDFLKSGYLNGYCPRCKADYNRMYWRRLDKR